MLRRGANVSVIIAGVWWTCSVWFAKITEGRTANFLLSQCFFSDDAVYYQCGGGVAKEMLLMPSDVTWALEDAGHAPVPQPKPPEPAASLVRVSETRSGDKGNLGLRQGLIQLHGAQQSKPRLWTEEDVKLMPHKLDTQGMTTGKLLPIITLEKWTVVSSVHSPPPTALFISMHFFPV